MNPQLLIDREVFLVLATAIAACQPVTREPAVVPPTSTPAVIALPVATVPDDGGASPAVSCSAIARQNETLLGNPSDACTGVGIEPGVAVSSSAGATVEAVRKKLREAAHGGLLDYCHEGRGRWAVLVVSAALGESMGESGIACRSEVTYQLVFVSASGERVVSKTRIVAASVDETIDATIQEVFDFDGDGRDELVLEERRWANGEASSASLEVLRAARSIEPYPVGYPIRSVTDADADGRPDFLNDSFFVSFPRECGLYATPIHGVPLLVHSLPDGTFTMGDETARRWARLQCPNAPKASSADPIVASCKRLWGRSVEEITRGLSSAPYCNGPSERELTKHLVASPPPFPTLDRKTPAPLPRTRPKE